MPLIGTQWLPESKVRIGNKKLWIKARKYAMRRLGPDAERDKINQFARKVYLMWGGRFFPRKKVRVMKHHPHFAHFDIF